MMIELQEGYKTTGADLELECWSNGVMSNSLGVFTFKAGRLTSKNILTSLFFSISSCIFVLFVV
jgi:hypothetical protein